MSSIINIGSGNGNIPEAQQFFDRLLTPPTGQREALLNDTINELVLTGLWAKLDALYFFAAATAQIALTNLLSDTAVAVPARGGTETTATVFTTDRGVVCSNLGYITTNFNPTNGGNYSLNDAMVFVALANNGNTNGQAVIDDPLSGGLVELAPARADMNSYVGLNNTHVQINGSGAASGFFLLQRTSSTALQLFKDNVSVGTATATATGVPNKQICFGAGPFSIMAGAIGKSLNSTERNALDTIVRNYLTALGAL